MKKFLPFIFIVLWSLNGYSRISGTKMWEKATETGRLASMLLPMPSPGQTNVIKNIKADLPGFIKEDIGESIFYLERMKRAY